MLSNISLVNFKSFRELTNLDIRPLTVLCGANSSGKSTLLKSILTLKQSYASMSTYDTLILNGEYVSNGFFDDVAHKRSADNFSIEHTFCFVNPFSTSKKVKNKTKNLQTYKALRKMYLTSAEYPDRFTIRTKSTFGRNIEDQISKTPAIDKYELEIMMEMDNNTITSRIELSRIPLGVKQFALRWENIPDVQHQYVSGKAKQCIAYFYGLQLGNVYVYTENLPKGTIISDVLPNIYTLCKLAAEQYHGVSFLGPLRQAPARAYMYTNETLSIGTMGEYTPFILAQNKEKKIRASLLSPKDSKLDFVSREVSLLEATQSWLNYLNISNINIDQQSEIVKLKIGDSNIADVGFGVSQVLPIVVEGLSILPEQTLILEQPEIHLHPNMQMGLADFLISLLNQGKQVILETHSDHIINRLIRRLMEEDSDFLLNNTAIYYVSKEQDESKIQPIEIDKIHGIAQCPEDFFTQYSSEVDMIVRTGFDNIRKRQ